MSNIHFTHFVGQVHNKVGRLGIWGYLMGNINLCSRTTLWKSKWCKSLVKFVKYVARRPSDGGLVDPSRMPKGSSRSDDRMLATRRPRTTFISRDSFVSSKKKFGIQSSRRRSVISYYVQYCYCHRNEKKAAVAAVTRWLIFFIIIILFFAYQSLSFFGIVNIYILLAVNFLRFRAIKIYDFLGSSFKTYVFHDFITINVRTCS